MSNNTREHCYACYRPQTFCMCKYITPIETKTRFVILMHPKEFRKTKNGTGHFTNLSLTNCEIFVGIDFTQHEKINALLADEKNACYVLYPSSSSINLNTQTIGKENKKTILFIIDATWPCSRAILRESPNLDNLAKVSFSHTKRSAFSFKKQPNSYCLSTIESTLYLLELLNQHKVEDLSSKTLENFLVPFEKMVEYQLSCNL